MDDIFGVENFRNEIVWCYTGPSRQIKDFPDKHDTILRYSKTGNYKFNANDIRVPYKKSNIATGRTSAVGRAEDKYLLQLDKKGKLPEDWWADIATIGYKHSEIVGFPTQKPEALLRRIIKASSNEGDLVLDPFCGCGTTVIVASKLNRQFIGIDIDTSERGKGELPTAFSVIKNRSHEFFAQAHYISRDLKEVQEMNPREFERWVNEFYEANKPHPDRGVDGITITDGIPIQTKAFRIGYEVIDKLLTSSRYHPLVPKPIKKIIVVSQVGFDDSARQRNFEIEKTEGIEVHLATPEEMLQLGV